MGDPEMTIWVKIYFIYFGAFKLWTKHASVVHWRPPNDFWEHFEQILA